MELELGQSSRELVAIIEERFSVQVSADRMTAFQFALKSFACERFGSFDQMVSAVKRGLVDQYVWAQILHVATNHETRFFRHPASIEILINACRGMPVPKILSVGCSSGEEPYSIASALLRHGHPCFKILGVDISERCIEVARAGIYPCHPELGTDVAVAIGNGKSKIHSWIRDMVSFETHNILSDAPISLSAPDVVITQNMLIYYRTDTRHEILNRLALELPSGGTLITGPAEDAGWQCAGMSRIKLSNASVFMKD